MNAALTRLHQQLMMRRSRSTSSALIQLGLNSRSNYQRWAAGPQSAIGMQQHLKELPATITHYGHAVATASCGARTTAAGHRPLNSACTVRSIISRGEPMDKLSTTTTVDDRRPSTGSPINDAIATLNSMMSASFMVDMCPSRLQPYLRLMRLDKPIGSWLLFWPCAWSVGLATTAGELPDFYLMALFGAGAVIMRGAGCIVNDMWDSDIDCKVERTRDRPLASGEISFPDAFAFLTVVLTFGDVVLMQLNTNCLLLGGCASLLVSIYPLMKRIVNWPQLFLGFTFNWGALLGWTAVHSSCDLTVCLPLYFACIAWTLVYDTIYAHQDKKDDVAIGVKSTALLLGSNTKVFLFSFASVMSAGFITAGITSAQTMPYYVAVALATGHVVNQIWTLNTESAKDCGDKFKSNYLLGFIIIAGIIGSAMVKRSKDKESSSSSPATLPTPAAGRPALNGQIHEITPSSE